MRFAFVSRGIVFLCCLCLLVTPTTATRVQRLTLTELRDQAASVVLGTVTDVTTRKGQKEMVWTDYLIRVEESLKGEEREREILVSFAGGQYGDRDVGFADVPILKKGETYVLFLRRDPALVSPAVGWGQGIFRALTVRVDGERLTVLVSYDGEPLQRTIAGRLRRGGRVEVINGTLRPVSSRLQSTPRNPREQDPVPLKPDGTLATLPGKVQESLAPPLPPPYASLDDLRLFLRGEMEEIEPAEQSMNSDR